jgi:putative ABC transport system ATP-binding protein
MIRLQNIEKGVPNDTVETFAINSINLDIAKGESFCLLWVLQDVEKVLYLT